jgi:hypothetical protein
MLKLQGRLADTQRQRHKMLATQRNMVLTVDGDDEDSACVVAGGGGGRGEGGAELLTGLDVGCAEDGPAWVPEGRPF